MNNYILLLRLLVANHSFYVLLPTNFENMRWYIILIMNPYTDLLNPCNKKTHIFYYEKPLIRKINEKFAPEFGILITKNYSNIKNCYIDLKRHHFMKSC